MRKKTQLTGDTGEPAELTAATPEDARSRTHRKRTKNSPWWMDLVVGVVVAVIIMALAKAFIFQFFVIPSESMENTLMKGDRIFVSKMKNFQPIERGDIVVFEDRHNWLPDEFKNDNPTGFAATAFGQALDKGLRVLQLKPEYPGGYLVKRVVGVGGDHVTCCNVQNQVEVNGKAVAEPYLKKGANTLPVPFDVTVPAGKYWVMGDNRDNSGDSRYHQDDNNHGFVDEKQIVGRVMLRYFPVSRIETFSNPGLNQLPRATKKAQPPTSQPPTNQQPPTLPPATEAVSPGDASTGVSPEGSKNGK
ncbi:signal peptidase I [uncultured Mobiluncus sp.]|uniref:signal peptidase I n=1 Tax=uncultured Mobiluncus sp. TaxID=293425 RepID=UPI0025DE8F7B|nr:signal peptidase I [uncultured Mobiluncus sp.]